MPYINPKDRPLLNAALEPLVEIVRDECGEGELNYVITKIVDKWLGDKPNYFAYNSAIGVLECAKLEFYRRRLAPYEDEKITINGDVYNTYMNQAFKPLPAIELPGKDESDDKARGT